METSNHYVTKNPAQNKFIVILMVMRELVIYLANPNRLDFPNTQTVVQICQSIRIIPANILAEIIIYTYHIYHYAATGEYIQKFTDDPVKYPLYQVGLQDISHKYISDHPGLTGTIQAIITNLPKI